MWRSALLVVVALCGAERSARAQAAPLPLELEWDVPAGCPDASVVIHRVEQIVLSPPAPAIVIARAKVVVAGSGRFVLTLTMRTGDVEETRTIDAAACSALADASAVVIALAIDPHREREPELGMPPPAPPPAPAPAAAPQRDPKPRAPAAPLEPQPPLGFAVGLAATVEPGTLPATGGGADLSTGIRYDRLRLGLHGALWLRQHPVFDDRTGAGASFGMVQLGAFGGYLFPFGSRERGFAAGPCFGLDADLVRVEGFGIREPRTTWTSWPTAVLGLRGEMRVVGRFGIFARVDVVLPIDAPTFTLGTAGTGLSLHEPAAVTPRFTLGTELLLP